MAIGGCFCNHLRYVADEMGAPLRKIAVTVTIELEGNPLVTKAATMKVVCDTKDGSDPREVVDRAKASCMVGNSVSKGFPVDVQLTA